jgi:hypothetical protein
MLMLNQQNSVQCGSEPTEYHLQVSGIKIISRTFRKALISK